MITVRVEQRHINVGVPGNCAYCPVMLALREPLGCAVLGTRVCMTVYGYGHERLPLAHYRPGQRAYEVMTRFDNGEAVEPCVVTFELWEGS
jgi:hypothetical protein